MYEYINIKQHEYSQKHQNIETLILSLLAFSIPLFLGHQQLVVGAAVNTFLILSALHLKWHKILPIIILPSIGAVTAGLLFGPLTHFLFIMIPFIWIGNSLLVLAFKKFDMNYWIKLALGIIFKVGLLFTTAYILYSLNILPPMFLTAMGLIQVYTALIGGVIAFTYQKIINYSD